MFFTTMWLRMESNHLLPIYKIGTLTDELLSRMKILYQNEVKA